MLSVGLFSQAKGLQDASDTMFQIVFGNVFFSYLSKLQDKKEQFKVEYRNILLVVFYAISLVVSAVFIYAEEIVLIIYKIQTKTQFFKQVGTRKTNTAKAAPS